MDTYCNCIIDFGNNGIPQNWRETIAQALGPNYRRERSIIYHTAYPGKTIQFDFWLHDQKLVRIFFKAFNAPPWSQEELAKFQLALLRVGAKYSSPPGYPRPVITQSRQTQDPFPFPPRVNTIIIAYAFDKSILIFSNPTLQLFRQIYFPESCIHIGQATKIRNGPFGAIMQKGIFGMWAGGIKYICGKNLRIIDRSGNKYDCIDGEIYFGPLLPIEAIQQLDSYGEFGLKQSFQPIVTDKSYGSVIFEI